jgi:hypothetical protein
VELGGKHHVPAAFTRERTQELGARWNWKANIRSQPPLPVKELRNSLKALMYKNVLIMNFPNTDIIN